MGRSRGKSGVSPANVQLLLRTPVDRPGIIATMQSDSQPSRRVMLSAAANAAGLVAMMKVPLQTASMHTKTFVLVHPAWHGAWCWNKVVPLLRARRHAVFTPTLTGLGERSHLAHPDIGLDVHITDVVNVLKYEDLRDVILVGHSSSGAVITGVADRAPERLGHVVYLDAFVPEDGQAVLDLITPDRRRGFEEVVKTEGEGWLVPRFSPLPWETIVRDSWGITDDNDVRWMLDRLGPTPFRHFKDPVRRTNPAADKLPRTYVRCRQYPNPRFDRHAAMAKETPGWRYRELAASHHPMVTMPGELTNVLIELA
jgi:pimeloyl-ACP methyl ester carboxylesterase